MFFLAGSDIMGKYNFVSDLSKFQVLDGGSPCAAYNGMVAEVQICNWCVFDMR